MNLRSTEVYPFYPNRRAGMLVHSGLILLLIGGGALGLYRASQAQIGLAFMLWLLPGLLAVVLAPVLAYQIYSLQTAQYVLERDGVRLRWGLRQEQIPVTEIVWVHTQDELLAPLPLPWMRIPGAVVGVRQLAGAARQTGLKSVEFLASEARGLVLIGTNERMFAISPSDTNEFLYTYHRLTELGSLTPLGRRSQYASFLLARVWKARPARWLGIASLTLSLGLAVWVALTIPTRPQVHLGFFPDGSPGDLAPVLQLLLLPVLNSAIVIFDLLLGLFFFRREETHDLAYLVWSGAVLTPVLFMVSTFFILNAG